MELIDCHGTSDCWNIEIQAYYCMQADSCNESAGWCQSVTQELTRGCKPGCKDLNEGLVCFKPGTMVYRKRSRTTLLVDPLTGVL